MNEVKIYKGSPYPMGATLVGNDVNFSYVTNSTEECGVVLYTGIKNREIARIPFPKEYCIGNISCMRIKGIGSQKYLYNFYKGEEIITDPYAKVIYGNEKWGSKNDLKCGIQKEDFDWGEDQPLRISYEKSIIYLLHVRGFTKHNSSKVEGRGTFHGIVEKIPYLKELGITALELMPAYEFEEVETAEEYENTMEYAVAHYKEPLDDEKKERTKINYWGYKEGYYFAPKASYCLTDTPPIEFKTMVKELHQNGIEVIMQFYFPKKVKQGHILEVLKYWIMEYHIDGIHLKGEGIPLTLIATEPIFSNTKLMYYDFPCEEIYSFKELPLYRNLASYQDNFMYDMRRFLKGDANMLSAAVTHIKENPLKQGVINYMSNYYGFTLHDSVSYERKHNEENGEDNKDGNNDNCTWNCGVEGPSRRKNVVKLRMQQMKNAMFFTLLSQGTPLIAAGDEFARSQKGNNNPYCQDNDITWLKWNQKDSYKELFDFIKYLIDFRKKHGILQQEKELMLTDSSAKGCPELSFHGLEPWKIDFSNYHSHSLGVMYHDHKNGESTYIYAAYNMHWQEEAFALPAFKNEKWLMIVNTGQTDSILPEPVEVGEEILLQGRTVALLISKEKNREKNVDENTAKRNRTQSKTKKNINKSSAGKDNMSKGSTTKN